MPSTNALRLLAIASFLLSAILLTGFLIGLSENNGHILDWEHFIFQVLSIASLLVLGIFLVVILRKNEIAHQIALVLTVIQGALIILKIYQLGDSFFEIRSEGSVYYRFILQVSYLFFPVGLLLTSLSYLSQGRLYGYSNRTYLTFAAVGSLTARFFFFLAFFILSFKGTDYFRYYSITDKIYFFLDPLMDIALLYFVFSNSKMVYEKPESTNHSDLLDDNHSFHVPVAIAQSFSTLWWMGKYLLLSIPLIGFIFLIIWSGKKQPQLLRNWAISHFWVSCIGIIIGVLYFSAKVDRESSGFLALLILPIILIVIGIIITSRGDQGRMEQSVEKESGIGTWFARVFIAGIPLVGLIYTIVLAADNSEKIRQNWAKAQLLLMVTNVLFYANYFLKIEEVNNFLEVAVFQF